MGAGLEEGWGEFSDAVMVEKCVAEGGGGAGGGGDFFVAGEAEGLEDGMDEFGVIGGENAKGVADFVGKGGSFEGELEVPGIFVGAGEGEWAVGGEDSWEGIFAGVGLVRGRHSVIVEFERNY